MRNDENKTLLEWAFGNLRTLISTEEVLARVTVPDGVDHQINAVLAKEFSLVVTDEGDLQFATETVISPDIRAPVDRGDRVGELVVSRGDQEFTRLELVAQQSTGLATWLRRIFNGLGRIFGRGE